jgi:hypothetical protein
MGLAVIKIFISSIVGLEKILISVHKIQVNFKVSKMYLQIVKKKIMFEKIDKIEFGENNEKKDESNIFIFNLCI